MGRGAYRVAEAQFRHAVWLNPFEPEFKVHQALALLQLGRSDEAKTLLETCLREHANYAGAKAVYDEQWPAIARDR